MGLSSLPDLCGVTLGDAAPETLSALGETGRGDPPGLRDIDLGETGRGDHRGISTRSGPCSPAPAGARSLNRKEFGGEEEPAGCGTLAGMLAFTTKAAPLGITPSLTG
mmetsp:Transcript_37420/g.68452  ORF Transcript_37420/g.68452 Transcript_37420/m.68452 type:complete len:108 (+) Transcript_37420:877-1200(+)